MAIQTKSEAIKRLRRAYQRQRDLYFEMRGYRDHHQEKAERLEAKLSNLKWQLRKLSEGAIL